MDLSYGRPQMFDAHFKRLQLTRPESGRVGFAMLFANLNTACPPCSINIHKFGILLKHRAESVHVMGIPRIDETRYDINKLTGGHFRDHTLEKLLPRPVLGASIIAGCPSV